MEIEEFCAFITTNLQNSSRVLAARTLRATGTAIATKSCKTVLLQTGFSEVTFMFPVPLNSIFRNVLLGCRQMASVITFPDVPGSARKACKMASIEVKFFAFCKTICTEKN